MTTNVRVATTARSERARSATAAPGAAPAASARADDGGHELAAREGEPTAAALGPAAVDPMARVLRLGNDAMSWGLMLGVVIAVSTHGSLSVRAVSSLVHFQRLAAEWRTGVRDFYDQIYEIEEQRAKPKEEKPPPPPEPEPEEEKPVVREKPLEAPKEKDIYDEPKAAAPKPVEAVKVLTQGEEELDLTGDGFASGNNTQLIGGQSAGDGTGKKRTDSPYANVKGTDDGKGKGPATPAPPAPTGPDLSKPPGIVGGSAWSCPWPPEAEEEQVDEAMVTLVVTVRPDGTPAKVDVTSDPGSGFGRAARQCALARKFTPGLDRVGTAITATTPPIKVRFTR